MVAKQLPISIFKAGILAKKNVSLKKLIVYICRFYYKVKLTKTTDNTKVGTVNISNFVRCAKEIDRVELVTSDDVNVSISFLSYKPTFPRTFICLKTIKDNVETMVRYYITK